MLQHGELHAENDKLRLLIQRLTRHQFGRRSEQLTPDQLQLTLEELEQTIAATQAGQDAAAASSGLSRKPRSEQPGRNHGSLPAHLPRYEVMVDVEDQDCPCCGRALHPIGELSTEQLDIVPSLLRVRVTRRPRYVCRTCEDTIVVAPAPDRPVDGGMPTEALVAHVVVTKFADFPSTLPTGADAGTAGYQIGPLNSGELGWSCVLVADTALRPDARHGPGLTEGGRR